jgi:hypothetical protein
MAREYTHPVTSYSVTMYGGTGFGWIQLKNGDRDAGYIYFRENPPDDGAFSSGEPPYIITSQPITNWPVVLDLLRNERPLFIRGYQATDGDPVSTFFGTATDEPVGEGEGSSLRNT